MPVMHGGRVNMIRLDADGPLEDEVTRQIRQAIREARTGVTTHLIDGEFCVAEITPSVSDDGNTIARGWISIPEIPEDSVAVMQFPERSEEEVGNGILASLSFREDLTALINVRGRENKSNTPDYLLAAYLESCLIAFEAYVNQRDDWYGVHLSPGESRFLETDRD
jgi:hypothetical protein